MDALRHAYDVLASSGMNEGLPADDVAKLLCESQRCADMSKRFKAYYLVELDERRLYQTFGCSSTRHFAQQHMDQDPRRTGELLQVGRALLTLPAIDTAFCNHEISWSKLRSLVRVVVPKHEAAWLAKAKELSCKALSREVLLSKEGTAPRKPGQRKGLAEIRYPVRYSLDVLTHEKCENAMRKLSDEFGHQLTGPEFMAALCDMALSSTPDGSIPGRNPVNDSLYKVVLNQDNDGLTIATADGPNPDLCMNTSLNRTVCARLERRSLRGEPLKGALGTLSEPPLRPRRPIRRPNTSLESAPLDADAISLASAFSDYPRRALHA